MRRLCGDCRRDRKLDDLGRCGECQLRRQIDGVPDDTPTVRQGMDPFVIDYLKLAAQGANRRQAAAILGVDINDLERALSRHDASGQGRTAAGTPAVAGLPAGPAPGYTHPDAACRAEDPVLFFGVNGERRGPTQDQRIEAAKAVCRRCPIVDDCAKWALNEPFGVWAGMTEEERAAEKRYRAARSAMNDVLSCGTDSSRRRHLAQGRTCEACGVGYEPLPVAVPLERVEAAA